MIQITSNNITAIAQTYFDGIKAKVQGRVRLYQKVFNYLYKNGAVQDIQQDLMQRNSKYADIRFLLKTKPVGRNAAPYALLNLNNLHDWVGQHVDDVDRLLAYLGNEDRLRRLILGGPEAIYTLDRRLQNRFRLNSANNDGGMTAFAKHLLDYGFHNKFSQMIALALDVHTCPYCNRLPIRAISKAGGGKVIGPDFDHFFSQDKHPFLGLSFYNLIPSCTQCNSRLKGAKLMSLDNHVHPYLGGFGKDCIFDVRILKASGALNDLTAFRIRLRSHLDPGGKPYKRIFGEHNVPHSGSNQLFQIETIYDQAHRDTVGRLRMLADRYSKGQAKALWAAFGKRVSKKDFYFYYFGNYMNEIDFHKQPLSKLTHDVTRQLVPRFFY